MREGAARSTATLWDETVMQCETWDTTLLVMQSAAERVAQQAAEFGVPAERALFDDEETPDDDAEPYPLLRLSA